ncbi:MAG: carboxypeptidase regulatory-like domain-containing protein [Acidobacteria bacterium]|nr:carboxypeptidase regulatory-like domain-containing protein [Acidobacteriota bacterium]
MRKKRRRCSAAPGASRRYARLLAALAAALWLASLVTPRAWAGEKKKSRITPQALLFGTVFQENGFSLHGARVVVTNADRPKEKKETKTDVQGEFAVRVPAGKARYSIEVSAEGFVSQSKTVEVAADERIDVTFRLVLLKK